MLPVRPVAAQLIKAQPALVFKLPELDRCDAALKRNRKEAL